jgi:hypothetical protein
VVEFWNEGEEPITGLRLTAWIFTPDDGEVLVLTPPVSQTVDLAPGLNVFTVAGGLSTPVIGPHRLVVNVGPGGSGWRVAGAAAQFDVGWAHLVELTTDRGAYAVGEAGSGRLDVYGTGLTALRVAAADGTTLLETQEELAGHHSFTFALPTAVAGDYLLVAESVDVAGGMDQLIRAYAVPGPRDTQPPLLLLTYPGEATVVTTAVETMTIQVTGQASDDRGEVRVFVNGEPALVAGDGTFSHPLEVDQGFNLVSVVALDSSDNITFSPAISVILIPERDASLGANLQQVEVGRPLTYRLVISASATLEGVVVTGLLPEGGVSNAVATTNYGQVELEGTEAIWTGDVPAEQPVIVTIDVTPVITGLLSHQATVYWGQGFIEATNVVTVEVLPQTGLVACELYPIALHQSAVIGASPGQVVPNIYFGDGPGNFGWLSWTGNLGAPALANSLTPAGDSATYVNPHDPDDHILSAGDWVRGGPGLQNAQLVRNALDALTGYTAVVPVWDVTQGQGNSTMYHVTGFAEIELAGYQLGSQQNWISARYLGAISCGQP